MSKRTVFPVDWRESFRFYGGFWLTSFYMRCTYLREYIAFALQNPISYYLRSDLDILYYRVQEYRNRINRIEKLSIRRNILVRIREILITWSIYGFAHEIRGIFRVPIQKPEVLYDARISIITDAIAIVLLQQLGQIEPTGISLPSKTLRCKFPIPIKIVGSSFGGLGKPHYSARKTAEKIFEALSTRIRETHDAKPTASFAYKTPRTFAHLFLCFSPLFSVLLFPFFITVAAHPTIYSAVFSVARGCLGDFPTHGRNTYTYKR